MELKTATFSVACIFGALFSGNSQIVAPETTDEQLEVKERTVMERFEPGLILPVEKRLELKKERIATIQERRQVIDTLDISERKRKKLLKELYHSPFHERYQKVLADFQEDPQPE